MAIPLFSIFFIIILYVAHPNHYLYNTLYWMKRSTIEYGRQDPDKLLGLLFVVNLSYQIQYMVDVEFSSYFNALDYPTVRSIINLRITGKLQNLRITYHRYNCTTIVQAKYSYASNCVPPRQYKYK